ncbi:MAG: FAD-dependent oxidoreductase [Acidobacteriota bacterium]|nr:FAD-dependent oxidoreductase [Acidobacteriota bacterium]
MLHERHEITVFEANDYVGGHTNTVRVDTAHSTHHVDTGFIVFNDRNYPLFERLLERIGVAWQPSTMSFSVSDGRGDFEYSSSSPAGLFAKPAHLIDPRFHRMLADLVRFRRAARRLLATQDGDPSLGDWLARERFSEGFIERLIVPQASAVWSAEPASRWTFPARFLLEFFDNHGMFEVRGRPRWRTIQGGSARYAEALTEPFGARIRIGTPVEAITRSEDHVSIRTPGHDPEHFDEVVLATHSDQALALLSDATALEREVLGSIPYQPNEAVLHTDASMLPRRRRAWASWNYHLGGDRTAQERHRDARPSGAPVAGPAGGPPEGRARVTYHMNRLQSLDADRELCVTLNRTEEIDPGRIVRRIEYAHPVFTAAGVRAQGRRAQISGINRTHFCGAYWGWGFHEDGVASGVHVAERFGGRL